MMITRTADNCRPGDADPTDANDPLTPRCRARRIYLCTREPHTEGQHVAGTDTRVAAVWTDDGPLEECYCAGGAGVRRILDLDCPEHARL